MNFRLLSCLVWTGTNSIRRLRTQMAHFLTGHFILRKQSRWRAVQPNPLFSGEMNYLANKLLAVGVTDIKQEFPKETVLFQGKDITAQVEEAWNFLVEHAFVM